MRQRAPPQAPISVRNQKSAPQKNWECVGLLSVQWDGSGSLPKTVSPTVTVPRDPGTQTPWPAEPGDGGAFLMWQPQKLGDQIPKLGSQMVCKGFPLGDNGNQEQ